MARMCGIRLGARAYEAVVLDGSAKKPKLRFALEGRVPAVDEFAREELADHLKGVVREHRKDLTVDDVGLAIDSGIGVYRNLALPFPDRAKIEEVLKFEVESEIPQWDIDELVCDFHVIESNPVESKLIVTAVPKQPLESALEVTAKAGLEPLEVELETTALFHAAEFAGLLTPEASQLLVHFGERSTSLVVVNEGKPTAMRALHLELFAEESSEPEEGEADESSEDEEHVVGRQPQPLDPTRQAQMIERVRREFGRTLTSADRGPEFDKLALCGNVPDGLIGTEIQGVPIVALDPLSELEPERDPRERLRFALAFSTAWRQMGGGSLRPRLRREELAFAGTFERLELPLGVLGLLLLTLLASQLIVTKKIHGPRARDVNNWKLTMRNWTIGEPEKGIPGKLTTTPPQSLTNYIRGMVAGDFDSTETPMEQFDLVHQKLGQEITRLRSTLGQTDGVGQPMSALLASTLVLDVFDELGEETLGRVAISKLEAQYRPAAGGRTQENVTVKLDLSFFSDSDATATRNFNRLEEELKARKWVLGVDTKGTDAFKGENTGISTNDLEIQIDVNRAMPSQTDEAASARDGNSGEELATAR